MSITLKSNVMLENVLICDLKTNNDVGVSVTKCDKYKRVIILHRSVQVLNRYYPGGHQYKYNTNYTEEKTQAAGKVLAKSI